MYKDSSGHYPEGVVPLDNIFCWRNKDGSWSLYDNDRFEDYTPFHEQLFAINWSGFKLKDNMFGGTVSFTLITGG